MRDVEPVFAAEREIEVVARDAGDLLRLESEQPADAVVLVDDVVAGAQVGERLERPAEPRVGARRPLAEDLGVGEQREPEIAPDEAATSGADDEADAPDRREARSPRSTTSASTLRSRRCVPQRLAAVREGDDDAAALAEQPCELVLGLGEPASRDRRALRLERVRLRVRERVELGSALERRAASSPPPPTRV